MIDPQLFRKNPEIFIKSMQTRGLPLEMLQSLIELDNKWLKQSQYLETLKHQRKQKLPKGKPSPEMLEELSKLSQLISLEEAKTTALHVKRDKLLLSIPNIPKNTCPIGQDENENICLEKVGNPKTFDFPVLDHQQLLENANGLHLKKAASLSGSRFSILSGKIARLERALINFMLDTHTQQFGYKEMSCPSLVKADALIGTGQLPKFEEDLYQLKNDLLWLSPTGEVQLTNFFAKETIPEDLLPLKFTTQTSCFRREAGSYGKDMNGIIRQHEFKKVELLCFCTPEQSEEELIKLRGCAEYILKSLDIPYQIVSLCTGDLGFSANYTYDLEAWFPSQNKYREVSSCSSFGDFQARRSMIKYSSNQTKGFVHTLNGSGLAVGRVLACLVENHQNKNKDFDIPTVLKKYYDS